MRIRSFLKESPVFQVNRSAQRLEVSLNRVLRDEAVTYFEALVLAAIFFEKKGGIKPSELAKTLETTRASVSHCVSSLEAKGLLRRRIDPEDARGFRLMLLPEGRKRAARVVGILDRMQRRFEQVLGTKGVAELLRHLFVLESLCPELVPRPSGDESVTP